MGLAQSLGGLCAGSLQLARQRLELAALDVEEELLRFAGLLLQGMVAVLLGTLALAALAATVVVVLWDTARVAALVGVTLVFAAGAGAIAWRLARALREKPPFLAATIAELRRDAEVLGAVR